MPPPSSPLSLALWNFSSRWFLLPQGTGIIALILHQLDYQFTGLHTLAEIVWIYTIVQLALCLIFYILRISLYPKHVRDELRSNIQETSCLASFCISFTTIIQMVTVQFGHFAGLAAYVLWWVNAAMAVVALLGIPYVQLKLQPPGIQNVPPTILLPYIAALTSGAAGGVVCQYGNISARLQVPVIIVSYLEVGAGFAATISLYSIVFLKHFNRTTPTQELVYQDMILCGPFGQGSFALQSLGAVSMNSFAGYHRGVFLTAATGTTIAHVSMFGGLLAWGYGTFWWCFAILSILHTLLGQEGGWRTIRYSLAAWGLIFPWVSLSSLHWTSQFHSVCLTDQLPGCIYKRSCPTRENHGLAGFQGLVDSSSSHAFGLVVHESDLHCQGDYYRKGARFRPWLEVEVSG